MSDRQTNVALNLSYVLHERSNSATVKAFVRRSEAERKRCMNAMTVFSKLSDAELHNRLVVIEEREKVDLRLATGVWVISVDIGASALLPRLLSLAGFVRPDCPTIFSVLDGAGPSSMTQLPLFGAAASLTTPGTPSTLCDRFLFASAVVRPGHRSLLLNVTDIGSDKPRVGPNWQQATKLAEAVIRSFPLQWWCRRALWPRPAEDTLVEFRKTSNGAT